MKLRHHFRDLQEWSDQGLTIKSTSSNCAVKLFDSALTQVLLLVIEKKLWKFKFILYINHIYIVCWMV